MGLLASTVTLDLHFCHLDNGNKATYFVGLLSWLKMKHFQWPSQSLARDGDTSQMKLSSSSSPVSSYSSSHQQAACMIPFHTVCSNYWVTKMKKGRKEKYPSSLKRGSKSFLQGWKLSGWCPFSELSVVSCILRMPQQLLPTDNACEWRQSQGGPPDTVFCTSRSAIWFIFVSFISPFKFVFSLNQWVLSIFFPVK